MVELNIVPCIGLQEKVGMMRGVQLDWIMYVLNSVVVSFIWINNKTWFGFSGTITYAYENDIFIVSYTWT